MLISETEFLKTLIQYSDSGLFLCKETIEPLFLMSWNDIESFLYQFEEEKLIEITYGGDEIQRVKILPTARARFRKAASAASVTATPVSVSAIGSNIVIGIGDNRGAALTAQQLSYQIRHTVKTDLRQLFYSVDRQTDISSVDAVEIKMLLKQIVTCLESANKPPANLLAKLSDKIQQHSWIASPLVNVLFKILEIL